MTDSKEPEIPVTPAAAAPSSSESPGDASTSGDAQGSGDAEAKQEAESAVDSQAAEPAATAGKADREPSSGDAPAAPDSSDGSSEAGRSRVKIGRQEGGPPPKREHKPRPNISGTPKHAKKPKPITPPSKRSGLEDDLQSEFDAIFNDDAGVDSLLGEGVGNAVIELESRIAATVTRVVGDDVFVSFGGPNEGIASAKQFKEPPGIGETVEVEVARYNAEDGYYEVTVPGASIAVSDWEDIEEGAVVEARVTGSNTGGLECSVNNIRGFIPASQIAIHRVEDFSEYVDQKLTCVVTEANPSRRNLVLSHRSILERELEAQREDLLKSIKVGDIREGVVRRIQDFGAFVDIGGVDGLVHISQLSWDRVEHPSEVVQEGQTIQVKVEKIDSQTGKIGLSYRSLQDHPWTNAESEFPAGSIQKGTVSKLAAFGAFVRLAPGVEGLVHISEVAHHRVHRVDTMVQEGQEVEVKVLEVDAEKQRMSLSMKALIQQAESKKPAEEEEDALPERKLAKHEGPLKGGMDRPSGGEQFGLKW